MWYPLFPYRVEIPYSRQHFIQITSWILHLRVKIPLTKLSDHGKRHFVIFFLFRKSVCRFFALVTDFRASVPSIPWKSADFSHQNFHQSVSKNFMKNQQSRSKPTHPTWIIQYHTIDYISIHYFSRDSLQNRARTTTQSASEALVTRSRNSLSAAKYRPEGRFVDRFRLRT